VGVYTALTAPAAAGDPVFEPAAAAAVAAKPAAAAAAASPSKPIKAAVARPVKAAVAAAAIPPKPAPVSGKKRKAEPTPSSSSSSDDEDYTESASDSSSSDDEDAKPLAEQKLKEEEEEKKKKEKRRAASRKYYEKQKALKAAATAAASGESAPAKEPKAQKKQKVSAMDQWKAKLEKIKADEKKEAFEVVRKPIAAAAAAAASGGADDADVVADRESSPEDTSGAAVAIYNEHMGRVVAKYESKCVVCATKTSVKNVCTSCMDCFVCSAACRMEHWASKECLAGRCDPEVHDLLATHMIANKGVKAEHPPVFPVIEHPSQCFCCKDPLKGDAHVRCPKCAQTHLCGACTRKHMLTSACQALARNEHVKLFLKKLASNPKAVSNFTMLQYTARATLEATIKRLAAEAMKDDDAKKEAAAQNAFHVTEIVKELMQRRVVPSAAAADGAVGAAFK